MFSVPSVTSLPEMSPLAAFSTPMAMRAALFWVATTKFAFVITPRSSVW